MQLRSADELQAYCKGILFYFNGTFLNPSSGSAFLPVPELSQACCTSNDLITYDNKRRITNAV